MDRFEECKYSLMMVRSCLKSIHKKLELIELFLIVVQEVDERVQFLKDMEVLGQAHKYYPIIRQEIAAKVREMERIDKERCKELEKNITMSMQD